MQSLLKNLLEVKGELLVGRQVLGRRAHVFTMLTEEHLAKCVERLGHLEERLVLITRLGKCILKHLNARRVLEHCDLDLVIL